MKNKDEIKKDRLKNKDKIKEYNKEYYLKKKDDIIKQHKEYYSENKDEVFSDFEERVTAHRGVLKSLIDQDGYFRRNEAVEINNGFGKQLSYLKLKLEAYKMLREKPTREDLFLSPSKEEK